MMRQSSGFTIVELMIAMVVLMIITAMAIPHYLSALQRGHEAVAVSFLRQIQASQEAYRLANQQYADTFAKLQPYMSAELVPPALPDGAGDGGFVTTVFAAPLPPGAPQGNSGSAPGQGGGTPPGQGGTPPGQGGTPPGQGGTPSGQGGGSSGGGTPPAADTKIYSMYIFSLSNPDNTHWSCTAEPVRDRLSNRFYYSDESNVIRYSIGALADSASSQI